MIKLKNILSESKFGYLVEKEEKFKAKSTKSGKVVYYKTKDAMDKAIKAKTAEPLDKKDKPTTDKKGAPVFKKDDKPTSKKDQEKAQKSADRKAGKELDNIKNTTIAVKEPGKADKNIAIKNILPPPFGDADPKKEHPEAEAAKKKVYEKYKEERVKEAKKEIKSRLKNKGKDGQPLLTKEEKVLYDEKVKEAKEFGFDDPPTKKEFLEEKITNEFTEKVKYYNPDLSGYGEETFWDKQEAGEDPFGDDGMFDLDDDDFDFGDDDFGDAKSDDYGNKLSKLGDGRQKEALETKMKLGAGQLTKVKKASNHRVTNKDGKPVQVSVFQDPETKKYYGITDEGDIYESDSEDFRNIKEPTTDARGFDGAVTAKGQAMMDMRIGKGGKEDEYDSTSFADLLDLLGLDTDIDYTNPFAAD
mgnify:CR=1 FL=1|jgi:hypothetical protein|tara:strand:+ start:126 stop:1370 length:1245 start_codon:yes stop_codon:yes gene_type:complete